ncbi:MAG: lipoyl domain-containing protein [Gemmataceae bacterium]
MRRPIVMPDLGPGDVTFNLWLVGPGQKVYEGDRVAEVLLDAATLDVLSPADGKVAETLARPGATVVSGETLGYVDA